MLQPISIKTKLAGNPGRSPEYAVTVKNQSGESVQVVDPRATRGVIALMDMNAVIGGAACHYGGPAAFAELMSAAHGVMFDDAKKAGKQWHELFHFVNDAGHCENGLYALKANYQMAGLNWNALKGFRSMQSGLTGHGESHLFPEGVYLSNGPLGSAFPQSQGLAMAEHLSGQNRVTLTAISDGACMEGEAREALAAVPGLAAQGKLGPMVLILSDNNTKLSGRIDQDSFSMNPSFEALGALGWKMIRLENGHDLQKCYTTIEQAVKEARANPKVPIVIHARTVKGIGSEKAEKSASGGHGFPLKAAEELPAFLKEIYKGEKYPEMFDQWVTELISLEEKKKAQTKKENVKTDKIQVGVSAAMIAAAKKGLPVVSVASDLPGSTGVAGFRKEFPQNSFDVGVAESNMISVAAGFSKQGYIPVVDTFAQFGVTKGALPLTMASLSQAPVICVFSHTGFQDAADGASHQGLTYVAMVSAIPHINVICLSCADEAKALVGEAIEKFAADRKAGKTPETFVFFLGRENFPLNYAENMTYSLSQAQVFGKGKVAVAVTGSTVYEAMQAKTELQNKGIEIAVVNVPNVNHPDLETLKKVLSQTGGRIVFAEDHQRIGGFSQLVLADLAEGGVPVTARVLAVHGEFGQSAYTAKDLYHKHKIDSDAIIKAVESLL